MTLRAAETELIRKALRGDDESFEALIFSCRSKAYNIAFRYLRNHEDASDALQESFIKIYRNLAGFKGESSFDTWVYRIVVNTCNDMIKKIRAGRKQNLYSRKVKKNTPWTSRTLQGHQNRFCYGKKTVISSFGV